MARRLFVAAQELRLADGSYWTGMVYPEEMTFPAAERTTYTAAAVVLAADALSGRHAGLRALPRRGAPRPARPARVELLVGPGECSARRRPG